MAGLLGMGGLSGLGGNPTTSNLSGPLAQLFNPANMRNAQIKKGLLSAGLAMMNPDPNAPPQGIGGILGRAAAGGFQGAEQAKDDYMRDGFAGLQLMEFQREQDAREKQQAAMDGLIPTLPKEIQSFARAFPQQFAESWVKAQMPAKAEPYTLGRGDVRYDSGNKPVAYGLPADTSSDWKEVQLDDGVYWVKPGTNEKIKVGERPDRNEGEGRGFTQTRSLRADYTKAAKPFEDLRVMYQRMVASYEGAQADNTGASDIAMVYSYMKMLDPTSVVREGEFATAQNAAGVPEQIRTMWNRLKSGDRLDPTVRDAFLGQATRQYQEQLGSYGKTREMFQGFARDNMLDPDQVAPDLTYGVVPYTPKSRLSPDVLRQGFSGAAGGRGLTQFDLMTKRQSIYQKYPGLE